MSINIGIQLTDLQPTDNNLSQNRNERNPADFYSSPPEPVLVEPGDTILTKACFLNLRQQNNGNIIVQEDTILTFKMYHYYVPQLQDGIDTGNNGDNQFIGCDVPILGADGKAGQGTPYILMCRKDYYNDYLLPCLSNASPDNPPTAPPFTLFDVDKLYTPTGVDGYGFGWTWEDFVPCEFYYNVNLKAGSYSPSYLAQIITENINSQPNGTSNQNFSNQPPYYYPPPQNQVNSVMYNPDYSKGKEAGTIPGTFNNQWFGGTQSNNPFYYNLFMLQNVEFANAWYNDASGNRKTMIYVFKSLYDDSFFHNTNFMFSGTTQASLEFNTNNSGLFSFNLHSPIINSADSTVSVLYRGFNDTYSQPTVLIYYSWLFTKQGGIMFSDLQPTSFWSQLGFDDSIKAVFDDPSGLWRMTKQRFKSITSDTYTTISQVNKNQTYLQSIYPIDTGDADDTYVFFQSSDFIEVFAKNTFISNLDDSGHYLLELSAYSSKFATNTTYQSIKMILPTYYTNLGSSYVYINQISGLPSSYTHFGEPFMLGYIHCRILKPNLQNARLSTGNYIYLEIIKPLKNIVASIKDKENDEKQQQLYAGQK
jgi:hypothetical protein